MAETVSVTDKSLRAWLAAGPVNRGIGDDLTFISSAASAPRGKASWVFRYRLGSAGKEKVLGRYPELSLKEARELCRLNRSQVQQGVDVSAVKRLERPTNTVTSANWLKPGTSDTSRSHTNIRKWSYASSGATSIRCWARCRFERCDLSMSIGF